MKKFKWYGEKVFDLTQLAALTALRRSAEHLKSESVEQAPVDTGDLRANCHITDLENDGKRYWLMVRYDLPYARVQHERLDFKHPRGGKAKYLEDPLNENADNYINFIRDAVRRVLK